MLGAVTRLQLAAPLARCPSRLARQASVPATQRRARVPALGKHCPPARSTPEAPPASAHPATSVASDSSARWAPDHKSRVCCLRATVEDLTGPQAELLSDRYPELGAETCCIEEFRPPGAEEQALFGKEAQQRVWDRCTLTLQFPPGHDVAAGMALAGQALGWDRAPAYQVEAVAMDEWVDSIRASYRPACVAPGMWVVPVWSEAPAPDAVNLVLEPGLAFGTGEHPTTRLCLRWLQAGAAGLAGARVMDYGTGSGILAIAALKLGAAEATGVDVDPLAVRAAARNAALSGVMPRFTALACASSGDADAAPAADPEYDVCVANILQGPLVKLAPRLAAYVRPGGRVALSGILQEQVAAIRAAYQPYLREVNVATDGPWALLAGIRN